MSSKTIIQAAISSAKTRSTRIQKPSDSIISLPLSTMAVAYASALPSKPAANYDRPQESKNHHYLHSGKQLVDDPSSVESNSKRFFYSSSMVHNKLPVVVQTSNDRTIDPYLGNLLDGFCNGSCHQTITR